MLPPSPLLQLAPARAAALLRHVAAAIWHPLPAEITVEATAPSPRHRPLSVARLETLRPVPSPSHWGKLWDQRWFRLQLPPARPSDPPRYLAWDDQSESTLYLDDIPHYGLDVAHRHAPVPHHARELWIESIVCQTGVWHPDATGIDSQGSLHRGPRLLTRDDTAWGFYHDLAALLDFTRVELSATFGPDAVKFEATGTKPALGSIPSRLRRLLHGLDTLADAFERSGPATARRAAARLFKSLPAAPDSLDAILTGHAHIDLVWLWPEHVGVFKTVHTFATANRLMDTYPEFRFGFSQPAAYAAAEHRTPGTLDFVRRRLRQGRWEATGATYVESDTVLPCGEALLRGFLLGREDFTALRGDPARVLWLPDVFGYSPCLPQLMRGCGVENFYTTKLSWSAVNRFPHSSFVWRGHDGSEVVAHVTHDHDYNQHAAAHQLRLGEQAHRQAHLHPEFLAPTGYGDGGGGPTEEMCERVRRYASLSGLPRARWGRIEDFFARLRRRRAALPVFQGELYLEYHRGTYTTHGALKANLRAAERALQTAEAVRCALRAAPLDPAPWRRVVFAQFHDYLPGSSIHEVNAEANAELPAVAQAAIADSVAQLDRSGPARPAWFNPLPRPRTWRVPGTERRLLLPALGGAAEDALPPAPPSAPVTASARRLAHDRLRADFDSLGRVRRLVVDGNEIPLRAPLGELVAYPDAPHNFEAWDIDRQSLALGQPVRSPARITIEREGTASATLVCRRSLGDDGEIVLRWSLEAGEPVLRLDLELDWRRPRRLLKILFPTAYAGRSARYGCPFGSVLRPQVPGDSADEAQWEVPASRWALVTDDGEREGLFVATEAKYGFSCRDGVLGLSLARSAAIPRGGAENEPNTSHPPELRRLKIESPFSDLGRHRIRLALGRHDASAPRHELAPAWADLLYQPCLPHQGGAALHAGLLDLEGGESLQPVWAKPADDDRPGWILRLNETLGRRGRARLRLAPGWTATPVDLLEKPLGRPSPSPVVTFTPYALLSLRLTGAANSFAALHHASSPCPPVPTSSSSTATTAAAPSSPTAGPYPLHTYKPSPNRASSSATPTAPPPPADPPAPPS